MHLIQPNHKAFFNRWAKRFQFPIPVALYVYKREGSRGNPRNALAYLTTLNGMAWVGVSTQSLKTDDWQNSIVHEFLHLMFLLHVGDKDRLLTPTSEETIVIMLSGWLARSKEGKRYSKRMLGI